MRKRNTFILAIMVMIISTGAIVKINQAPSKRSNAPGEQSCGGCHAGNVNTGVGTISLNLPTSYIPGTTYTLTHSISDNSFSNPRHGFTTTVLDSADEQAGSFALVNTTTTSLQTALVAGKIREYLGHKSADSPSSWDYEWTAPNSAVGDITFYTVSVYANRNGAISGDFTYEEAFTLSLAASYPQPAFATTSQVYCLSDTIELTNTSTGTIDSYSWDFGADATPASSTDSIPPVVLYSSGGMKTISLTTTGPDGTESSTQEIMVHELRTVDAGPDLSICEGDSTLISVTIDGTEEMYELTWSGAGWISDSASATPTISADTSGFFVIEVSSIPDCGMLSDSLFLTVDSAPIPTISGTDSLLSSTAAAYQWYYADSAGNPIAIIPDATTQSLIAEGTVLTSEDNTGFIIVEVSYESGCMKQSEPVEIRIATSIEDDLLQAIEVFPNPASDNLSIRFGDLADRMVGLRILTMKGELQKDIPVRGPSKEIELDMSGIPAGIYLLQIQVGESFLYKKIVKN